MKEQERYQWAQDYDPLCPYGEYDFIVDAKAGKILNDFNIKDLLNEQDKEIKDLTKLYDELNKKYCEQQNKLDIVREENRQLKKTKKE
jgi:hypothetical protein